MFHSNGSSFEITGQRYLFASFSFLIFLVASFFLLLSSELNVEVEVAVCSRRNTLPGPVVFESASERGGFKVENVAVGI